MQLFADNSLSIGHTPLVRLNRMAPPGGAAVLAKVEGRNPAYSVKCRIGAAMIWDAEGRGLLGPGHPVTIVMPETMSLERRRVLRAFGATLVLTEGAKGMKGAIERAEEMAAADPDRYFLPQQFRNPANPRIHQETTGPEIWEATGGNVDVLVAGVGTGGTITGITRHFKQQRGRSLLSVAVEPAGSPVLTQARAGQPLSPGPHAIQGIGAGFVPDTLDLSLVDRVEQVTNEEAFTTARRLAREEGILSGIAGGAAAAVALRLAAQPAFKDQTIVCILPDAGERYLSTPLFDGLEA